jgi:hypothetical protein
MALKEVMAVNTTTLTLKPEKIKGQPLLDLDQLIDYVAVQDEQRRRQQSKTQSQTGPKSRIYNQD